MRAPVLQDLPRGTLCPPLLVLWTSSRDLVMIEQFSSLYIFLQTIFLPESSMGLGKIAVVVFFCTVWSWFSGKNLSFLRAKEQQSVNCDIIIDGSVPPSACGKL